jgi:ABC-type oligopeptide transport system substrate-binding subunit
MGDAINLAQRMESAAEPGTVWITEETHKLIAPLFETEALGRIQVKGRTQAVSAYRVLAVKEVAGKVRGIAGLESPLVGREAEFAGLQKALERLQGGVGGIVTVVGEAGIGKSRLVAEARRDVALLRLYNWIEGRCLSYGHSMAYLLWGEVLRGLVGVGLEDAPEAVRLALRERVQALCPDGYEDVYPYLARLLSLELSDEEQGRLDELDGQELKSHTFQAVQTLIGCAAREEPLVLVCEDLHWADPTSIELLEQVLGLVERVPLLLVCVFRPAKDHACWHFRELAAQTYAERHTDLLLEALTAAESQALVANLLEIEDLPQVLRQRILERAEGNPFYVEEVIRSLIDRDAIVRDAATGHWTATREVATIPIPDTLQGVLMARIDRLQEEARRVLQMASVIGRIFLYRVLAEIAAEERRLDERLWTLQREEMIRQRARIPDLEYIFKHDLTREAAYNGLLKKDRRAFHRQVAEALERLFPERVEEQLGLLAYHCERARNAQKASDYLLRAGDQARIAYAHQEAIGYYERALPFLKQLGEHEQAARTLMKLGLTHHTAYEFRESREAYEEGFALWQRASTARPAHALPPAPHYLRLSVNYDPGSLDPTKTAPIPPIFCGLVVSAPKWDVVPDVAQGWEVLEGGRRYIFHLRHDVRWTDGAPVTAGDFVYAWKRVLDPSNRSGSADLLCDVRGASAFHRGECEWANVGLRAVDGFTLVVELEEPTGHFLHLLSLPATYPVPRHVVEVHSEAWAEPGNIVTNGPFQLEAWQRGESILFARNPHYHGWFKGNVQRVQVHFLHSWEWSARLALYEAHSLDSLSLTWFPPSEMDLVRGRHAGEYISAPVFESHYLAFVMRGVPFDDVRVRRAFVMGTDREAVAHVIWRGAFFPFVGGLIPPGMPGHSPEIGLPYDPQKARHLLAQAGYPDGRGFPTLQVLVTRGNEEAWKDLQAQWRQSLGIDAQINHSGGSWDLFFARLEEAPPHMFYSGWTADYPDPDNFLRVGLPRERMGWQNEAYDQLLQDARRSTDQAARMKLFQKADRILMRDAIILPLVYGRSHLLVKPWVENYLGGWQDVVIKPH